MESLDFSGSNSPMPVRQIVQSYLPHPPPPPPPPFGLDDDQMLVG